MRQYEGQSSPPIDIYAAFVAQLAGCVAQWKKAGLVTRSASDDHIARALLALVVGYVVQAAVVGGINPKILRQGLEGLVAS